MSALTVFIVCLTVIMCCALVCATIRDVVAMRCDVDRPRSLAEYFGAPRRGEDE